MTGEAFKNDLKAGKPKFGLFVNSHSPTVTGQLAFKSFLKAA